MEKIPVYFSIDFEDYSYDLRRSLGSFEPSSNKDALKKSYKKIKDISSKYLNNRKITFFVTGIVARENPDLIREIYKDGHEISCHYNFHDEIYLSSREEFSRELDSAINTIFDITHEKPLGFRAPHFSIRAENVWAYEELSKRFAYDSSYTTSLNIEELAEEKIFHFNGNILHEFFIYEMPIFNGSFKVRSGGTFLRVFPSSIIIKSLKESINFGHIPLLYMHPYELIEEFWVPWKEVSYSNLGFFKKVIKVARQYQRCKLGVKSVDKKLRDIFLLFDHQGPMKELI